MQQIKDIQNELNIIQMQNNNISTGYKYLHFFPDDSKLVLKRAIYNVRWCW